MSVELCTCEAAWFLAHDLGTSLRTSQSRAVHNYLHTQFWLWFDFATRMFCARAGLLEVHITWICISCSCGASSQPTSSISVQSAYEWIRACNEYMHTIRNMKQQKCVFNQCKQFMQAIAAMGSCGWFRNCTSTAGVQLATPRLVLHQNLKVRVWPQSRVGSTP